MSHKINNFLFRSIKFIEKKLKSKKNDLLPEFVSKKTTVNDLIFEKAPQPQDRRGRIDINIEFNDDHLRKVDFLTKKNDERVVN